MLAHRLHRGTNIETTLGQILVFAGSSLFPVPSTTEPGFMRLVRFPEATIIYQETHRAT